MSHSYVRTALIRAAVLGILPCLPLAAQRPTAPVQPTTYAGSAGNHRLTVDRIFRTGEFRSGPMPDVHWLKDGISYIDLASSSDGYDIVRVDAATGKTTVLMPASALVDASGKRLDVEDMTLSKDETKALLFHHSERVWRQNTKGQYTVADFSTKKVTQISPSSAPKLFAKFSPDGRQVAFVRANDLYVVDIATGTERRLTADGSANIVNGTSDWVYEEEFDLRDGFRWSPDGRAIAFWRFDQSNIPLMTLVDQTDSLYPSLYQYKYPKAGAPNSVVTVGVVYLAGGAPRFMQTGTDASVYIPRMGWVGNDSLWIERMPRAQNRADLLIASAATGLTRSLLTDTDSAYVDVLEPVWINNNKQLVILSDRTGWRQAWLYNRDGSGARQVTSDGFDVLDVVGVDSARGDLYVKGAAPNPTQAQIYRYSLSGRHAAGRVTPMDGTYDFNMSPTAKYVATVWSTINTPPTAALYELPSMRQVRILSANTTLKARVDSLHVTPVRFFKIPAADGATMLDAYRILPPSFDSTKKYPVVIYAYGGPAIPQVLDSWMGGRYLFHQLLAERGYVIVVADNRGAAWRGRHFRKQTQRKLGVMESDDQIAVAKWIGAQSWGDASRIAMWGWSYGGYNTAMSVFRGGSVFKLGISVAPVTDWRFYDSIYTERFMSTPADNAEGYRASSPLTYVQGLTAKYLLIHGTGDDNVHPENSYVLSQRLQLDRKSFSLMLFPNKTHSISGPGGTLPLYDLLERFIMENL